MKLEAHFSIDLGSGSPLQLAESMARLSALIGSARAMWDIQAPTTPAPDQSPQPAPADAESSPRIVGVTDLPTPDLGATNGHSVAEPTRQRHTPSKSIPFDEFDQMVRAEMRKLSRGGIMPGYAYWDSCRNPKLPTLQAVILRYKCKGIADLAERLGYLPPERASKQSVKVTEED